MEFGNQIKMLRTTFKMSQEELANQLHVSRQAVQKWEAGSATPDIYTLIEISKFFGVPIDYLVLNRDGRMMSDIMNNRQIIKPQYSSIPYWESYSSNLTEEYRQCIDEGLDIEKYKMLFEAVSTLPKDEIKKKLSDIIFEIVLNAKQRNDYKYIEPSEYNEIQQYKKPYLLAERLNKESLKEKVHGAWMGRICGCMLGKTVECIKSDELIPFLKETDNYPMHRYIYKSDINEKICNKYNFPFRDRAYADTINGMPVDDDTNYTVLAQLIIEKYGKDFTPLDVSKAWVQYQSKNAYCTAERVAYCNFINGYEPPQSAIYKNPYREWIGAQIRGDYFGYINPGNPEAAAEMAWRDASISHIKNGIYGEMFVAAMIAAAAVTADIKKIILSGLAQIPYTSRLYESVISVLDMYNSGVSRQDCFDKIHKMYDEYTGYGWCHTISNAMIVAASLLYGNGDYGKSVCMAVETGFDTDCNGATVGSILGMANGIQGIPEYWTKPINDTLHTSIFGVGTVKISERVDLTMKQIDALDN